MKADEAGSEPCSIEEMLGEPTVKSNQVSKSKEGRHSEVDSSKIIIADNKEKISNSSSPLENEQLQRQQQAKKDKNLIELDFEMTDEMKQQQQSINFGSLPFQPARAPSGGEATATTAAGDGFKKQGQ